MVILCIFTIRGNGFSSFTQKLKEIKLSFDLLTLKHAYCASFKLKMKSLRPSGAKLAFLPSRATKNQFFANYAKSKGDRA